MYHPCNSYQVHCIFDYHLWLDESTWSYQLQRKGVNIPPPQKKVPQTKHRRHVAILHIGCWLCYLPSWSNCFNTDRNSFLAAKLSHHYWFTQVLHHSHSICCHCAISNLYAKGKHGTLNVHHFSPNTFWTKPTLKRPLHTHRVPAIIPQGNDLFLWKVKQRSKPSTSAVGLSAFNIATVSPFRWLFHTITLHHASQPSDIVPYESCTM